MNAGESEKLTYRIEPWNFSDELTYDETVKRVLEISDIVWVTDFVSPENGITVQDILDDQNASNSSDEEILTHWREGRLDLLRRSFGLLVYDVKGEIVGFSLAHENDTTVRLGMMYILKPYRGKGIGSEMMKRIVAWHPEKRLTLSVIQYNYPAISFYKKHGFVECSDPYKPDILSNGKEIPNMYMEYKSGEKTL